MKPFLGAVIFEVTPECNLSCRYCYNTWKRPGCATTPPIAPFKQAEKTLKRLFAQADIGQVTLTGGEPLTCERLAELALTCRMKKTAVTVISNGTFATPQRYHQLLELGVTTFELPCHSADEEVHDRLVRHKGAWRTSLETMRSIRDRGGRVVAVTVLTKENLGGVAATLRFLASQGIREVMLNRFNVGGEGIRHQQALCPSICQLRDGFAVADQLGRELGIKLYSAVCTPACVLDPDHYPHIRFGFCEPAPARRAFTLDAFGRLRYCNHSPEVIGNIFTDRITSLLQTEPVTRWREEVPTFCRACEKFNRCRGGCRAASLQLGKPLSEPDPLLGSLSAEPLQPSKTSLPDQSDWIKKTNISDLLWVY